MDDTPIYKRHWFYTAVWLAILLVVYGWQIYRMGGFVTNELEILFDLACVFPILLVLWLTFFSQFVLPVRTFRDRQKIFDRLIIYLFGGHGPAMFIRNGVLVKREGEEQKKGPGVLWLDSASAAVTRTATAIKQTIGPGVHFIDRGEFIAGTIDLHIQSQSVGPKESDKPFDKKEKDQSEEEYYQVQDRRKQVSAWTRDGIEVIPNISVSFRVDTGFPREDQPGSRFGFRNGITKKDKAKERIDKEVIQKAILGEGINPIINSDSPRHHLAWNQLPIFLAVDVWREYVAKFTLDELFKADQLIPHPLPPIPVPTEDEIDLLSQPVEVTANQNALQQYILSLLREINKLMDKMIKRLERTESTSPPKKVPEFSPTYPAKVEVQKKTALQVINEMVKARLTQEIVDVFDDHGVRINNTAPSPEFALLQKRGLRVLSVGINTVRLNPTIEDTIINKWSGVWLRTAKEEKKQIERRRNIVEALAQKQAMRQYTEKLSIELNRKRPLGVQETLKALLKRTRRTIIENENLRQRMNEEQIILEEIIKWIEVDNL